MSTNRTFYDEPSKLHGCKMPNGKTITLGDQLNRIAAEVGSRRLGEAIDRYVANGGKW